MLNASALLHKAQSALAPYADAKGLLIAVSGGPDSMALLRLMVDWAQAPNRPRLLAATVDHALRDASLDEAKRVARWCTDLNIEHTILTWEGAKPTSRIQEMARAARYDLLIAHGAGLIDHVCHIPRSQKLAFFNVYRLIHGGDALNKIGLPAQKSGRLQHVYYAGDFR